MKWLAHSSYLVADWKRYPVFDVAHGLFGARGLVGCYDADTKRYPILDVVQGRIGP